MVNFKVFDTDETKIVNRIKVVTFPDFDDGFILVAECANIKKTMSWDHDETKPPPSEDIEIVGLGLNEETANNLLKEIQRALSVLKEQQQKT